MMNVTATNVLIFLKQTKSDIPYYAIMAEIIQGTSFFLCKAKEIKG
jgi:hypothetical protein